MIETARAKAAPHGALSSSRKLIPFINVVWCAPDLSLAAIDPLLRYRRNGDNIRYLHDIIDLREVVMSLSAVPSKVYWQDADRSDQAEKSAKTPASPQQSPRPEPSGEAGQSNQNQPSLQSHDDLKSGFRPRLYAKFDHWLDENLANLVEDALQATRQSRTNPVDKPE